jgi:hypothetical protein
MVSRQLCVVCCYEVVVSYCIFCYKYPSPDKPGKCLKCLKCAKMPKIMVSLQASPSATTRQVAPSLY